MMEDRMRKIFGEGEIDTMEREESRRGKEIKDG